MGLNYLEEFKKSLEEKNALLREKANKEKDPLAKARLLGKAEGVRIAIGAIYDFERIYDGS